mgnify:CR=1 FL=1
MKAIIEPIRIVQRIQLSGLLIRGGTIVNEGESYRGWIVVEDERIALIR